MSTSGKPGLALRLYSALVIAFLIFPLLIVVPISFSAARYLQFPPQEYGLRWYHFLVSNDAWRNSTILSLVVAAGATIVAIVAGTMAAKVIARSDSRISGIFFVTALSPQLIPAVVVALGALISFSMFGLYGSKLGLVLVHATLGLPFVLMILVPALRQVGDTTERAARVLGAGPVTAFVTVTVPSILPALAAAMIFVFFVSFDELLVALFVMAGEETLPMRIWSDLKNELTPAVAAVAVLLTALTVIAIVPAELVRRRSETREE